MVRARQRKAGAAGAHATVVSMALRELADDLGNAATCGDVEVIRRRLSRIVFCLEQQTVNHRLQAPAIRTPVNPARVRRLATAAFLRRAAAIGETCSTIAADLELDELGTVAYLEQQHAEQLDRLQLERDHGGPP